jgi:uracil-DNA glycosylase
MYDVAIVRPDDLVQFRDVARRLIAAGAEPACVLWHEGEDRQLFGAPLPSCAAPVSVPAAFVRLAEDVICHCDGERFALLYQALWRLVHGERYLLQNPADALVHRLLRMAKAVRRDIHKMHAFVRFRRLEAEDGERFVAWFEPEHYILRRAAPFFVGRFAAMRWSILTPNGSLHWNRHELAFAAGVSRAEAPSGDTLENWWRTYYRAVFNPARANAAAMRAEMPKKYWRNLPEAGMIPRLLAEAPSRTQTMLNTAPAAPRKRIRQAAALSPASGGRPRTIAELAARAGACERCPLYAPATQTVFGEGPGDAQVVFVGEQPGDEEDLAGRPFVGPAGRLFDQALVAAGVDRARVYVTNAVKHFKFTLRGKRRMHQRPGGYEIEHCRWWLDQELALLEPRLTVALGATAAYSLLGRQVSIMRERGKATEFRNGLPGLITVHPSFLLRFPDASARTHAHASFIDDLRQVAELVPAIRLVA